MKLCTSLLTCIAFALSACTSLDHTTPDGSVTKVRGFGGKGFAKTEEVALAWNNERSFYHGTVLAGTLAATAASAYATAATEATSRHVATEATKRHAAEQATQQLTTTTGASVVKHANSTNAALEIPAQIVTPKGY